MTGLKADGFTARKRTASKPSLMKLSMAPICAATSVPVLTTRSSLIIGFISGLSAYAFRLLIIWMRHVLPTNPLARAMRYGGFLAGNCKVLVELLKGLKQSESASAAPARRTHAAAATSRVKKNN